MNQGDPLPPCFETNDLVYASPIPYYKDEPFKLIDKTPSHPGVSVVSGYSCVPYSPSSANPSTRRWASFWSAVIRTCSTANLNRLVLSVRAFLAAALSSCVAMLPRSDANTANLTASTPEPTTPLPPRPFETSLTLPKNAIFLVAKANYSTTSTEPHKYILTLANPASLSFEVTEAQLLESLPYQAGDIVLAKHTAKAEPYRVVSVNIEAKKENQNDEDYAISAKVQLEQEIGIKTWDDALNYRMATSEEAEQSFPGPE